MPWRGPSYPGEFPTLGYVVTDFIEASCAIPDGEHVGEPYLLTAEMQRFVLWYYRLDPRTGRFVYFRGGQLIRPQKWGKGPFSASLACAEAEGPVLFDGWDAAGEPVGRPWPTPEIQITAVSEDQTQNVWRALVPMIELGALKADIPDTGDTRINLAGGGLIRPVTSSARSRLGQRLTWAIEDQTESWVESNHGRELADNQRRNIAGMRGRWLETGNAWDPNENSVAQQTSEEREPGVFFDDVEPDETLSIRNKRDRRKMLRQVYGDSLTGNTGDPDIKIDPWIDPDRIDGEIVALLTRDPSQAERFFGNRKLAGAGKAFPGALFDKLADPHEVPARNLIVVGIDGARFVDALAMIATDVVSGYQWPLGIWERPKDAEPDYEHPADEVDEVLVDAFERYQVWRVYIDPGSATGNIDHLLDKWQGRWGEKRVLPWYTHRLRQTAFAVRSYLDAIAGGDLSHNGGRTFTRHVKNAVRRKVNFYDDDRRQLWVISKDRSDSPRKIDAAMAAVLSWEARGDAIAAGAKKRRKGRIRGF